MVQIKIEKVDILSIRKNPDNPRVMNKQKFRKLIESIKEFPQMLKLRPIVVNSDGLILGGNMRYTACLQLNHKQVYIIKAEDLTDEQIKQFIIKDNVGFGDWDWDILANSWDTKKLQDWGMDVWQPDEDVDYSILEELDLEDNLSGKESSVKRAIQIEFEAEHYNEANELISKARKEGKDVGWIVLNAFKDL
jgi:hypothetical protein